MRFAREDLERFASGVLQAAGCEETTSDLVARTLVNSDARGTASHGLVRVLDYAERLKSGGNNPTGHPRLVAGDGATAIIDGDGALGQVVGNAAMRLAVELAHEYGIGAVACRNSSHFGAAAEYSLLAAAHDCIGLALTNASASMAPFGGITTVMGNNPLAIAAPTHPQDAFALDLAFSVVAKGRIRMKAARGQPIPEGWATDNRGVPTTNPEAALAGLAAWAGGYKGYGLALATDVLCGVLSGGGFGTQVRPQTDVSRPQDVSHLMLAIHVPHFLPVAAFRDRMTDLLGAVRSSEPAVGSPGIQTPGQRESEAAADSAARGIEVASDVWEPLERHARAAHVPIPTPLNP